MAIGHIAVRTHSRKQKHTAAAGLAYRHGLDLTCSRTGERHDYSHRTIRSDIVDQGMTPGPFPDIASLATAIEEAERRSDSRIMRDVQIALPHELDEDRRTALAETFAHLLAKRYDTVTSWAVHRPDTRGDARNHHAHIILPTRPIDTSRGCFGKRKLKALDGFKSGPEEIKAIRTLWEETANEALREAGRSGVHVHTGRTTHPQPTLGVKHCAIERKAYERRVKIPPHDRSAGETVGDTPATKHGRALAQHCARTQTEHLESVPVPSVAERARLPSVPRVAHLWHMRAPTAALDPARHERADDPRAPAPTRNPGGLISRALDRFTRKFRLFGQNDKIHIETAPHQGAVPTPEHTPSPGVTHRPTPGPLPKLTGRKPPAPLRKRPIRVRRRKLVDHKALCSQIGETFESNRLTPDFVRSIITRFTDAAKKAEQAEAEREQARRYLAGDADRPALAAVIDHIATRRLNGSAPTQKLPHRWMDIRNALHPRHPGDRSGIKRDPIDEDRENIGPCRSEEGARIAMRMFATALDAYQCELWGTQEPETVGQLSVDRPNPPPDRADSHAIEAAVRGWRKRAQTLLPNIIEAMLPHEIEFARALPAESRAYQAATERARQEQEKKKQEEERIEREKPAVTAWVAERAHTLLNQALAENPQQFVTRKAPLSQAGQALVTHFSEAYDRRTMLHVIHTHPRMKKFLDAVEDNGATAVLDWFTTDRIWGVASEDKTECENRALNVKNAKFRRQQQQQRRSGRSRWD